LSQFCRACGTDLRAVRAGLERPDAVTNSAATARNEISRAVAAKIRELESSVELKRVAEDVLPKLEEFLESPEEKRLRRMRTGMIVAGSGLGAIVMFVLAGIATKETDLFIAAAFFGIAFFVGLAIIINGKLLTVQPKQVKDRSEEAIIQDALDHLPASEQRELPPAPNPPASIIEHTTHRLSSEPARRRQTASQEQTE
jgi:hypothetical protein